MNKDVEKARQEGINLANAMSMTSKKLVDLSVIAGTVSASEEAARKRQNLVSGTVDAQRQFGQNVLESEFGKQILADIELQSKNGKSTKEIAQNLANNLAIAVAQGAVTTEQARSIAAALGEELGSYEIPALISGKLVTLL
jgi:polyhydroxyalkanoate synthesis regulator phasin